RPTEGDFSSLSRLTCCSGQSIGTGSVATMPDAGPPTARIVTPNRHCDLDCSPRRMPRWSSAASRAGTVSTRRAVAWSLNARIDPVFFAVRRKSIRAATAEFDGGFSTAATFARKKLADEPLRRLFFGDFEVVAFFQNGPDVFAGAQLAIQMHHVGIPGALA